MNGSLDVEDANKIKKNVANVSCNLVEGNSNFSFNLNISDKILLADNLTSVQSQMDEFIVAVRAKMAEMGYQLTI